VRVPEADTLRHCHDMVVTGIGRGMGLVEEVEAYFKEPLDHRYVRFFLRDDRLLLRTNHAGGDGRTFTWLITTLIQAAHQDKPELLLHQRGVRAPVLRALSHHYLRRPGNVVRTLRLPRPAPPRIEAVAGVVEGPIGMVASIAPPGVMEDLRRWRATTMPDVPVLAILCSGLARCLDEVGLPFYEREGIEVLVDARRYLPPDVVVDRNFVSSVYVEPGDLRDPRQVAASLHEATMAGRPLASLVVGMVRDGVRRSEPAVEGNPAAPAVRVSLSYLPRMPLFDDLPWRGGPQNARLAWASSPDGSIGLNVVATEVGGGLQLSAVFREGVLPRGPVRAAIERLCADPVSVMEGRDRLSAHRTILGRREAVGGVTGLSSSLSVSPVPVSPVPVPAPGAGAPGSSK
jgi:hypothetical protein